jgi:hypothetical protein
MRLENLQGIRRIEDIPFGGILWDAGQQPVFFDSLVLGIDLLIWNTSQPGVLEATTPELREAVLLALALAIENVGTPGAAVYSFESYTMFAFETVYREQMLAEMSVQPLMVLAHEN